MANLGDCHFSFPLLRFFMGLKLNNVALGFKFLFIFGKHYRDHSLFCDLLLHVLTHQFNEPILLEHEYKIAVGR